MRCTNYLVIILLLIAQTSFGQIYQNMAQPGYKFSRARFDSVLTIPMGLGNLKNISGGQDTGQIRFNKSDSSVYVWNGRAWIKPVAGGADTTKIPLAGTAVGKPITGDLQFDNAGGDKRIKGNASSSYIEFTDDGGININKTTGSNVNIQGIDFVGQNYGGAAGITGGRNYSTNYTSLSYIQKVYSDSITNFKLNKTDTASMLSAYARSAAVTSSLALKLNISDTATMLTPYARTSALATKLNISDTATMLSPYSRVTVSSYGKNATRDSTILLLSNGTRFAARDSVGGGGASGWSLTGNASAVTDFLGTTNNRTMRFRTNNVERMVIDSTGSVGIGTGAPLGKLDIRRNDALDASSLYIINASTTGANNIMLGENSANRNLGFGWFPSGSTTFQSLIPSTAYMYASSEASQLSLNTTTATQPITFCTNNWVERMRVTGAGRLLLGKTTESTFIFDAVGNSRITGNINLGSINQTSSNANSNYIFIGNGNINSGNTTTPDLSLSSNVYYNGTNNVYTKSGFSSTFYLSQAGDFQFYTTATGIAAATATLNERMRLTNSGSLLVGTTTENTSAALNVTSTTKGVLFPRMTTTQKNAIATPAAGLQVYDTTLNQMSYYNGTTWVNF